jgi:hypothetical protein
MYKPLKYSPQLLKPSHTTPLKLTVPLSLYLYPPQQTPGKGFELMSVKLGDANTIEKMNLHFIRLAKKVSKHSKVCTYKCIRVYINIHTKIYLYAPTYACEYEYICTYIHLHTLIQPTISYSPLYPILPHTPYYPPLYIYTNTRRTPICWTLGWTW